MRIGAKVPNSGPLPAERGIAAMAAELEAAGFDSLWVSDHVVMPATVASRYPFAADGRATWPSDTPYYDAMVSLAVIAAATSTAVIGTAVLVLPQRQPVILAKEAASIDAISKGRLCLGVGAGWLAEEFEALGAPFEGRGERFVEWVRLLRSLWEGSPPAFEGVHYRLPEGVISMPRPAHRIPLLVGGDSRTALGRAATIGDGWLAHQSATALDPKAIGSGVRELRFAAGRAGRPASELWTTLRIVDSATRIDVVAGMLADLAGAGVDEIVVDVDWASTGAAAEAHSILRREAARL